MRGTFNKFSNIGSALRLTRRATGMTQEDFEDISSRVYISEVEVGRKAPTLVKLDDLAKEMKVHPLTVLTLSYLANCNGDSPVPLLHHVLAEVEEVQRAARTELRLPANGKRPKAGRPVGVSTPKRRSVG